MTIRKLFKFENAHIVRNCTSKRCRQSIHGHSYKIEVLFHANTLDNAGMVYDFGLTKLLIKELIDSFDHAITLWREDEPEYLRDMKKWSDRWVEIPINPSAENYALIIFAMVQTILNQSIMQNGEGEISVFEVVVHETDTGYAKACKDDVENFGIIDLHGIIFSKAVMAEWRDSDIWTKILDGHKIVNPTSI